MLSVGTAEVETSHPFVEYIKNNKLTALHFSLKKLHKFYIIFLVIMLTFKFFNATIGSTLLFWAFIFLKGIL